MIKSAAMFRSALFSALILASTLAFSSPNPVGKWKGEMKFDFTKLLAEAKTPEQKKQAQEFVATIKQKVAKTTLGIEIKADGTLVFSTTSEGKTQADKGTWKIDSSKILVELDQNKSEEKTYLTWSKDEKKLLLIAPKSPDGMAFSLEFTRQK